MTATSKNYGSWCCSELAGCCALYYRSRILLYGQQLILVKCYLPMKSMQPWVVQPEVVKIFRGALQSQAASPQAIGWARPGSSQYHHPQPPSKYIGYSKICQEVYLHLGEINLLRQLRSYGILWDIFNLTERKYANRQKKRPGHVLQRSPEDAHHKKIDVG